MQLTDSGVVRVQVQDPMTGHTICAAPVDDPLVAAVADRGQDTEDSEKPNDSAQVSGGSAFDRPEQSAGAANQTHEEREPDAH